MAGLGRQLTLNDLDGQDVIMYSPVQARYFNELLISTFTIAGATPRYVQTVTQVHTMLVLVRSGIGIALVPASAATVHPEGVVFRSIGAFRERSVSSTRCGAVTAPIPPCCGCSETFCRSGSGRRRSRRGRGRVAPSVGGLYRNRPKFVYEAHVRRGAVTFVDAWAPSWSARSTPSRGWRLIRRSPSGRRLAHRRYGRDVGRNPNRPRRHLGKWRRGGDVRRDLDVTWKLTCTLRIARWGLALLLGLVPDSVAVFAAETHQVVKVVEIDFPRLIVRHTQYPYTCRNTLCPSNVGRSLWRG